MCVCVCVESSFVRSFIRSFFRGFAWNKFIVLMVETMFAHMWQLFGRKRVNSPQHGRDEMIISVVSLGVCIFVCACFCLCMCVCVCVCVQLSHTHKLNDSHSSTRHIELQCVLVAYYFPLCLCLCLFVRVHEHTVFLLDSIIRLDVNKGNLTKRKYLGHCKEQWSCVYTNSSCPMDHSKFMDESIQFFG